MIRINGIELGIDAAIDDVKKYAAKKIGVSETDFLSFEIIHIQAIIQMTYFLYKVCNFHYHLLCKFQLYQRQGHLLKQYQHQPLLLILMQV